MSQHRGAKQLRRYGLSRVISLLSLRYLLSVKRWPIHLVSSDLYDRLASLLNLSILQSSKLMPLNATNNINYFELTFVQLCYSLKACRPSKTTNYALLKLISHKDNKEQYFKDTSTFNQNWSIISYCLSYTLHLIWQYINAVKVYRVFPSSY